MITYNNVERLEVNKVYDVYKPLTNREGTAWYNNGDFDISPLEWKIRNKAQDYWRIRVYLDKAGRRRLQLLEAGELAYGKMPNIFDLEIGYRWRRPDYLIVERPDYLIKKKLDNELDALLR